MASKNTSQLQEQCDNMNTRLLSRTLKSFDTAEQANRFIHAFPVILTSTLSPGKFAEMVEQALELVAQLPKKSTNNSPNKKGK